MEVKLVIYTKIFLDNSWIWLNDPEIKLLTNTPTFSKKEQLAWFDKLPELKNYKIWGIEADNKPIGVCGLKNITNQDCEYWGYIGEKEYWGKGIGKTIISELETYAKNMGLQHICLKVLKTNPRAQYLYVKIGYQIEKENNELFFMKKSL